MNTPTDIEILEGVVKKCVHWTYNAPQEKVAEWKAKISQANADPEVVRASVGKGAATYAAKTPRRTCRDSRQESGNIFSEIAEELAEIVVKYAATMAAKTPEELAETRAKRKKGCANRSAERAAEIRASISAGLLRRTAEQVAEATAGEL